MIFGCRCISVWIQMSCCSFLEGRAGLIEQQCNLFVVQKTGFFPPSCCYFMYWAWFLFFSFSFPAVQQWREGGRLFSHLLLTSPLSEEERSQPCSVAAAEPTSLACQGHVVSCGLEHRAAGWSAWAQLISARSSQQHVGVLFLTSS